MGWLDSGPCEKDDQDRCGNSVGFGSIVVTDGRVAPPSPPEAALPPASSPPPSVSTSPAMSSASASQAVSPTVAMLTPPPPYVGQSSSLPGSLLTWAWPPPSAASPSDAFADLWSSLAQQSSGLLGLAAPQVGGLPDIPQQLSTSSTSSTPLVWSGLVDLVDPVGLASSPIPIDTEGPTIAAEHKHNHHHEREPPSPSADISPPPPPEEAIIPLHLPSAAWMPSTPTLVAASLLLVLVGVVLCTGPKQKRAPSRSVRRMDRVPEVDLTTDTEADETESEYEQRARSSRRGSR